MSAFGSRRPKFGESDRANDPAVDDRNAQIAVVPWRRDERVRAQRFDVRAVKRSPAFPDMRQLRVSDRPDVQIGGV
jgi:hypothetical protein